MKKIYLLKPHQDHGADTIATVGNDVADGLIKQGAARECQNRDFLVRPEIGSSKAFNIRKLSRAQLRRIKRK